MIFDLMDTEKLISIEAQSLRCGSKILVEHSNQAEKSVQIMINSTKAKILIQNI